MGFSVLVRLAHYRFIIFNKRGDIEFYDFKGQELLEDESVRESMKELQAAGEDNLDPAEVESLIRKVYKIQGKHSYILDLIQKLYR